MTEQPCSEELKGPCRSYIRDSFVNLLLHDYFITIFSQCCDHGRIQGEAVQAVASPFLNQENFLKCLSVFLN